MAAEVLSFLTRFSRQKIDRGWEIDRKSVLQELLGLHKCLQPYPVASAKWLRTHRVRCPDRHRILVKVHFYFQPRRTQGSYPDQRPLKLGVRDGGNIMKGEATAQNDAVRRGRRPRQVAYQPQVHVPDRHGHLT